MDYNSIIIFGIVAIIVIILLIAITRLIFSIPTFLRQQKAMIKILSEIAINNGVDPDKIDNIINTLKGYEHP